MKRKLDWRVRLDAYLAKADTEGVPHGNCLLFADGAVKAMTGKSLLSQIGIEGDIEKDQYKSLRRKGYKTPEEAASDNLEEIPPALAGVGDIALMETETGGPAFGIVVGSRIRVLRPGGTTGVVDLTEAKKAYRL